MSTDSHSHSHYSFHCAGPHPVRLRQYEAAIMPKAVSRIFGTLAESFNPSPVILAGCKTMRDVEMHLTDPTDADKAALREYFSGHPKIVMAINMPVKQAILAKFGPHPDPMVIGAWLGLEKKAVHLCVPYTGRDPSKKDVVTYVNNIVFSTAEAELVTDPFPTDVTFPEPPAPAVAVPPVA